MKVKQIKFQYVLGDCSAVKKRDEILFKIKRKFGSQLKGPRSFDPMMTQSTFETCGFWAQGHVIRSTLKKKNDSDVGFPI